MPKPQARTIIQVRSFIDLYERGWAAGERSAATRPIAMRRRSGERTGERRISSSSAWWQGLQSVHSRRGSGTPGGSMMGIALNQVRRVQIEQREVIRLLVLRELSRRVTMVGSPPCMVSFTARRPFSLPISRSSTVCSKPAANQKFLSASILPHSS